MDWQIIFSGVNAVFLVILVLITAWYAWSTARILGQVSRQTEATVRQALATEKSLANLQQTIEEQRGIGLTILTSALQSALRGIEHWKNENLVNLAFLNALPERVALVPEIGRRAVGHARLISPPAAVEMASALDELERCEEQFEIARRLHGRPSHEIERQCGRIRSLLESAELALLHAQELLRGTTG